MVRLLCFFALALGACKTGGGPGEPTTILVEPSLPESSEETPPPNVDEPTQPGQPVQRVQPIQPVPPPRSAILSEPLHPVRGGLKVLPPYRGQDPCRMALTGESPVAKACSQGGVRKAIDLMQTFVRRAKAVGIVFECSDCHIDEDDRSKLAPQADAEFRKLLFLAHPDD